MLKAWRHHLSVFLLFKNTLADPLYLEWVDGHTFPVIWAKSDALLHCAHIYINQNGIELPPLNNEQPIVTVLTWVLLVNWSLIGGSVSPALNLPVVCLCTEYLDDWADHQCQEWSPTEMYLTSLMVSGNLQIPMQLRFWLACQGIYKFSESEN